MRRQTRAHAALGTCARQRRKSRLAVGGAAAAPACKPGGAGQCKAGRLVAGAAGAHSTAGQPAGQAHHVLGPVEEDPQIAWRQAGHSLFWLQRARPCKRDMQQHPCSAALLPQPTASAHCSTGSARMQTPVPEERLTAAPSCRQRSGQERGHVCQFSSAWLAAGVGGRCGVQAVLVSCWCARLTKPCRCRR